MAEKRIKKRLNLDLPLELHKELKFLSVAYNTTITKLIIREIIKLLERHKVEKWSKKID